MSICAAGSPVMIRPVLDVLGVEPTTLADLWKTSRPQIYFQVTIWGSNVGTPHQNGGMESLVDTLDDLHGQVSTVIGGMLRTTGLHDASDTDLAQAVARGGDMLRMVEAVVIEAVGEIVERSQSPSRDERLTTRLGCHNVSELVQRLTRCAPQTAARVEQAAKAVAPAWDMILGEARPARLPAMREAMLDGEAGIDGVLAVAGPLLATGDRAGREKVLLADEMLAAAARGEGPDSAPPACADLLKVQAHVWAAALDQDGAEPRDRDSARRRGVTFSVARDGVIPFRGALLPEVAAQLQRIFDAVCSPYTDGRGGVRFTVAAESSNGADDANAADQDTAVLDDRTRPQKQHDALAAALFAAAASGDLPTIGGAAPTLVVTARAEDLARGEGWAFLEGCDEPVPIHAATRVACSGVVQRLVHGDTGRIVRLGTEERVFNRHQRRAIGARDGGCLIPGCGIPAGWCEIHHVTDHAKGGQTHTDNGVLLCWFHHRFIDTGPWRIRMNDGIPELQAPTWFDHTRRWRSVTRSRTRILRTLTA